MRGLFICLGLLFLVPSLALSAYLDPVITSNDGKRIVFEFAGDAGEATETLTYVVRPGTTKKAVREWVKDTLDELDGRLAAAKLPDFAVGQSVTRLNRTAAVRAAKEVWNDKLARYLYLQSSGITAAAGELAAMKADLEATYQAGFLTP